MKYESIHFFHRESKRVHFYRHVFAHLNSTEIDTTNLARFLRAVRVEPLSFLERLFREHIPVHGDVVVFNLKSTSGKS